MCLCVYVSAQVWKVQPMLRKENCPCYEFIIDYYTIRISSKIKLLKKKRKKILLFMQCFCIFIPGGITSCLGCGNWKFSVSF